MIGKILIVRIEESDVFPRTHLNAEITRNGKASIGGVVITNPFITLNISSHRFKRRVVRAIIDDQNLPLFECLREHTSHSTFDKMRSVECGKNDREKRASACT